MEKQVYFFSQNDTIKNSEILDRVGQRGREAAEFSEFDLPILPGFIIDSEVSSDLHNIDIDDVLKKQVAKLEKIVGKKFGDTENPMLMKIVISPNLTISRYPTLHNFGLTDSTLTGFQKFVGTNFGFHEYFFVLRCALEVELKISDLQGNDKQKAKIEKALTALRGILKLDKIPATIKKESFLELLPKGFMDDPYFQLKTMLERISLVLALEVEAESMPQNETAIIVQPMVYGNYGKDSASGIFFTRNVVTGESSLDGEFFSNKFDSLGAAGADINKIDPKYLKQLEKIARVVEDRFKEIRSIRFTIEHSNLWLIDQKPVMSKSVQAEIKTLLDLYKRKIVDAQYLIKTVKPSQLVEILHPVVDMRSVKTIPCLSGGIAGAPGAAVGHAYFTTEGLIEAYKKSKLKGEPAKFILIMEATYAEDVKAIEVSQGVLSSEGGYAAHASVVARQYGKVSLVRNDMKIMKDKVIIGGRTIKEGDFITLNVPNYGDPQVYHGKATLIEPDPEQSGLIDFIAITKEFITDFKIMANADSPRDATLALRFGAAGIGLCRTEHMFFDEKRINIFREMIVSDTPAKRSKALAKLFKFQEKDFYEILKIMDGKKVTIRLLDAPLHEFLPHDDSELKGFVSYLKSNTGSTNASFSEINEICENMREVNPMLGHRGCRIAVSYPEIYEMQVRAILSAAYKLKAEKISARPEIMIPIVMNEAELKLIVFGKKIEGKSYKGILEIVEELKQENHGKTVEFNIGTMIELPGAALSAGNIAKYANFFSFGTNDLTQTTMGLSRDDFNNFLPDYTQLDLLESNPFQMLVEPVKELVEIAVRRGRMTRPGLKAGLCGEQGAMPENIRFCIQTGLNYVSCSSYSVPIAMLAVAQYNLEQESQ